MKAIELLLSDSCVVYIPMTFAKDCRDYLSDIAGGRPKRPGSLATIR